MMKRTAGLLLAGTSLLVAGCAGPVILGINLGTASTVGSVVSTAATGKGLGEHALSAATERDCRIIEGLFRKDREICEEKGSEATKSDFRGLAQLFEEAPPDEDPAVMTASAETGDKDTAETIGLSPAAENGTAPRAVEVASLEPVTSPATAWTESPRSQSAADTAPLALAAAPEFTVPPAPLPSPVRRLALATPPAPQPKPAADGAYVVQVGTFARPASALSLVDELRKAGYAASHDAVRVSRTKRMTVVRVRGFNSAETAEAAASRIRENWRADPTVYESKA